MHTEEESLPGMQDLLLFFNEYGTLLVILIHIYYCHTQPNRNTNIDQMHKVT